MEINKSGTHPKLAVSIKSMCIDLHNHYPFFGEYNLMLDFQDSTIYCGSCNGKGTVINVKDETITCIKCKGSGYGESSIKTCAVNVTSKGMNFYWNRQFLDPLTQSQVNFVDVHELFHLIYNHSQRTIAARLDPKITNIAQDMIINHTIWVEMMKKNKNHFFFQIPTYKKSAYNDKKGLTGKNLGIFLPKEYTGEHIFEFLYVWLKEKHEEYKKKKEQNKSKCDSKCSKCNGTGETPNKEKKDSGNGGNKPEPSQNDGDSNGDGGSEPSQNGNQQSSNGNNKCDSCDGTGSGQEEPKYGKFGADDAETFELDSIFDMMDSNEGLFMDQHIADEVPEEVRDQMTNEAIERLKSRGLVQGNLESIIRKLRKKRKDYLKEIKRAVSNEIFGTQAQKSILRPNRRSIEGLKGYIKTKCKINVILDTSGSMTGLHEKVLSYIYRHDIVCNLIQCDTYVHSITTIKKARNLDTVKLKGFGGTILQPAVDVVGERFNKYNTVILTDGYTDRLDLGKLRGRVLIITTNNKCPIARNPSKGVKQIKIDEKYN